MSSWYQMGWVPNFLTIFWRLFSTFFSLLECCSWEKDNRLTATDYRTMRWANDKEGELDCAVRQLQSAFKGDTKSCCVCSLATRIKGLNCSDSRHARHPTSKAFFFFSISLKTDSRTLFDFLLDEKAENLHNKTRINNQVGSWLRSCSYTCALHIYPLHCGGIF